MENYHLLNCSHYFIKKYIKLGTVIKMKKIKVLTIMGIFLVSAMIFSVPPTAAVAPKAAANEEYLLVGTTNLGYDLDPQFSWDSASSDINNQVWEGLFAYDLGDPSLRVIPVLAAECGVWAADGLSYAVTLREGVTFSDGSAFNATAVKYSFDRLGDLCVYEGDQVGELYFPFGINGTKIGYNDASVGYGYIINETVIVDDYHIIFELNYMYVPFEAVLCFSASFIMHPTLTPDHIKNPGNSYLEFANISQDIAIGTGPYIVESHGTEEVVFEYNPTYHRGEPAILRFKYIKYTSSDTISVALLDETLDYGSWSADFLQDMRDSPHMVVGAKRPNTIISYLGYNNLKINLTMRKVMNLAIDYDYIIDEVLNGQATRMTSIIPPGILYHIDCDVPTLDLVAARALLIDEDFTEATGLDETSLDADWIAHSRTSEPVGHYLYTYNLGNIAREDIGIALMADFAKVGIRVQMEGVTWGAFLYKLYQDQDSLDLYRVGWMPDYNDPSNYVNPLMSNTSGGNSAQVNDPYLQELMDNGTKEIDPTARQAIYEEIQTYLAEVLQPWAFLFTGFSQNAVNEHITIQRNAMGYQYLFAWGWNDINTTWNTGYNNDVYCTAINENIPEDFWPEVEGGGIPGYSMFILLGVVAATIVAIIKKRK
jgi:peptide/nickel transport system substrate-binding protein